MIKVYNNLNKCDTDALADRKYVLETKLNSLLLSFKRWTVA